MTTKALYWIALGAFALALNSEYQNGGLPLAHRVAGRAEAVYCQVAARAEQSLAMARLVISPPATEVSTGEFIARQQAEIDRALALHQAELNRAMALRQAELDRVQQRLDRVHIVMDRVQMEKLQKLDNWRFQFKTANNRRTIVVCPETGAKISVDADGDAADQPDPDDVQ